MSELKKILKDEYGVELHQTSLACVLWALSKIECKIEREKARKEFNKGGYFHVYKYEI